jgi:GNAT superfamily N-acetyltransferase
MKSEFIIHIGIKPEHIVDAARLYANAFQHKFLKILGTPDKVTKILKDGLNPDRGISAISNDNELLGIVGYHLDKTSLTDIKFKSFINNYGILKGIIKFVILAIIFYRKADNKNQLMMDGIAVKDGYRGLGIGKELFNELENLARNNNITEIKLDVIDENPEAKKLYQNIGFVPIKYTNIPKFINNLIGVSGVTAMIKKLK